MTTTPRVSIVMPAFNAADTIEASIDSVLGQTLSDIELIVVDDGSTDATRDIVAAIHDRRVRLESQDNRGPSAARNRGIAGARAEFIAFLDADDFWQPQKLERQLAAFETNDASGLVYSWTDNFDAERRFLRHGSHVRADGEVFALLLSRNFIDNGSAPLVRRSVLDTVGTFDERLTHAEDWDLWLRIASEFPFVCVPHADVAYTVRAGSSMSSIERQVDQTLQVLERYLPGIESERERIRIKQTATSNLYKYVTVRLVETSTSRQDGWQAARYWAKFVGSTPTPVRVFGKAIALAAGIAGIIALPPGLVNSLRNRIANRRRPGG